MFRCWFFVRSKNQKVLRQFIILKVLLSFWKLGIVFLNIGMDFVTSHFGKMNLWPVEHFFQHICHHFWVGLLLLLHRNDLLQNPYFNKCTKAIHRWGKILKKEHKATCTNWERGLLKSGVYTKSEVDIHWKLYFQSCEKLYCTAVYFKQNCSREYVPKNNNFLHETTWEMDLC